MKTQVALFSVAACLLLATVAFQNSRELSAQPAAGPAEASKAELQPPDLPRMIETWKVRRDAARDRWLENQKGFAGSGRPGPLAVLIHQDRGIQEAASRIVQDLEKLQQTAKTEAEQRAGLVRLRDEWKQVHKQAQEIWRVNRQMMAGGGRPGLNAATINTEGGVMEALDWVASDLEKVLGKPPAPPPPEYEVTAQAVIDRLPKGILTVEQLERFLEKNKAPELTDEVVVEVKRRFTAAREGRIDRLHALSNLLLESPVVLTSNPSSPVFWHPDAKDAAVAFVSNEEGVEGTLSSMRDLLRRLTGSAPKVRIWYYWKGADGKDLSGSPTYFSRISVPIQEMKPLTVSVTRHVQITAEVPEDEDAATIEAVTERVHSKEGSLTVEVKPLEFPTEIAGRWTGTLVITDIPVLAHFKDDGTLAPPPNGKLEDALAEGCSIPPEVFRKMKQELEKLKGKEMTLTVDLKPQNVLGGQATLAAAPPQGTTAIKGTKEPPTYPYRYANGTITIEGTKDKMTTVLRGTFIPATQGWTIRGTWKAFGEEKGKKIEVMNGTWSGTNPNAK